MKTFTAVVERDVTTDCGRLYYRFPGAHTQAETLDELKANLQEVLALVTEYFPSNRKDGNADLRLSSLIPSQGS